MKPDEVIFLVEEAPEGGFDARALGHSIYTQAETIEELREMVYGTRFAAISTKAICPGLFGCT